MGLFKRRKSVNQGSSPLMLVEDVPLPTPIFARHQQTSNGEYIDGKGPYSMEMPDLRFSKLDLDIDMNNFNVGPDSRPGSVVQHQAEERRRSKMTFLGLNNNSKSIENMEEAAANQAKRKSSSNNLNDAGSIKSASTASRGVMTQDRKKLVASATEAMNLDVPVKAPNKPQATPSPLGASDSVKKSKKELKKEEKERQAKEKANMEAETAARIESRARMERERASKAIMERDRAKQAAREAKQAPKVDRVIFPEPERKKSNPELRPNQADTRRAPASSAGSTRGPIPERSRSKSPAPSSASGRRPPSAPPNHKPPPLPTDKQAPGQPQQQQSRGGGDARPGSIQFPRPPNGTAPASSGYRSQSAIPAADGIARPVGVRGQTLASDKRVSKQNGGPAGPFDMPMTSSPPTQAQKFPTGRTVQSSYRTPPQKMARGSSSDDGGTSTSAEGPSLDSATSLEDTDAENEQFVDARSSFANRPRPRRDEEREERAQSRLSGAFDLDVIRAVHADEANYHSRTDSAATDRFSALLASSRPGGAGDRSASASEIRSAKARMEEQRQRYLNNTHKTEKAPPPPPPQPIKRVREVAPTPKKRVVNIVRPEFIDQGVGWSCKGVRDLHVPNIRERMVAETILVPRAKRDSKGKEINGEPEMVEQKINVRYNDLFELIWTSTTPDVISRLFSHLDLSDLKSLRQVSHSVRFTLDVQDNREMILNKYLACVGYRSWTTSKEIPSARTGGRSVPVNVSRDPCPLSFKDCEAFLISHDLVPEYTSVGREYAADPSAMDPRMSRLAQASTRAYSKVLARLRMQPIFKIPSKQIAAGHPGRVDNSSSGLSASPMLLDVQNLAQPKHNSYYPAKGAANGSGPPSPSADSIMAFSPNVSSPLSVSSSPSMMQSEPFVENEITSPWKPGRAALFRVWVPASDPNGWLSDEEMTQCESQLFKAGIWNFLKKGDVVWNTAVGEKLNEGKYVFDGKYLRDLSYAHDAAGHLPSWLNCVLYSPSYWHNVIFSSTPRPIIFFDISPWKDQILNSLRLVQDHVEGFSNTGNRYRIAKWLYRSAANIACGQIISKMSGALEIVDEGWNGRIVIETEGTAEHAKALISRCAGPTATPQAKAALLASVMGDAKAAARAMNTNDTFGLQQSSMINGQQVKTNEVQNSPWMIMRERSRPGLIWIKLVEARK